MTRKTALPQGSDATARVGGINRPQGMIRGEDAVVAMAVLPWRGHEVRQAVEKLEGREIDDAVLSRAGGLALPGLLSRRRRLVALLTSP